MSSKAFKNGKSGPAVTKHKSEAGQVLLLVVLASVIALTVGLAAISRSITSTRISSEETNSQKALAAAEAGIEEQINRALSGAITADSTLLENNLNDNSRFISEADPVEPARNEVFELNNGDLIPQDEGVDIWLSNQEFDPDTRVTTELVVYWQRNTDCSASSTNAEAAIEVAWIYGDPTNPSMGRATADRCRTHSTRLNNFSAPGSGTTYNGTAYSNSLTVSITDGYIARVIPLYGSTKIAAVSRTQNLPIQGYVIESTGEAGETVRKLQVYQGHPKLPIEFFPYNLFIP